MTTLVQHNTMTPLRLTARGRLMLGLVIFAIVGLFGLGTWLFLSGNAAVAVDNAEGTPTYQEHVVQPGDTLWGISARLSQGQRQSEVLEQILAYNHLESSELEIGETLFVPVIEP